MKPIKYPPKSKRKTNKNKKQKDKKHKNLKQRKNTLKTYNEDSKSSDESNQEIKEIEKEYDFDETELENIIENNTKIATNLKSLENEININNIDCDEEDNSSSSEVSEHEEQILRKGNNFKNNSINDEKWTIKDGDLEKNKTDTTEEIKSVVNSNDDEQTNLVKIIINDLNLNETINYFCYKNKKYYLYTPISQRKNCNILSWKCTVYRQNEISHKGRNAKLCYGTISLNKSTKEVYLSKNHSNYCNEVNKIMPDNLVDINLEIAKKDNLIKYMEEYYDKNPLINLNEFSKEALNTYNRLKCNFNITPNTWKNILYSIKRNNNDIIDIILKKMKTYDGYQFFRNSNINYNPFLKKIK